MAIEPRCRSAHHRDVDDGIESLEWIQGGWRLVSEAYPLLPDRRSPGGRIIGAFRRVARSQAHDRSTVRSMEPPDQETLSKLEPWILSYSGFLSPCRVRTWVHERNGVISRR
jgi:hypothetical protein